MKKTIVIQVLIFIATWFIMTPDQLVDNTYVFGLFGSHDVVAGNSIWVLLGAAVLSVINIWVWWPSRKVVNTPAQTSAKEVTKSVEAEEVKTEEKDPIVPKMD